MKNGGPTAELLRLQKILAEKNKKIVSLEFTIAQLKSQLADSEKTIDALQASCLDVLEDLDKDPDAEIGT